MFSELGQKAEIAETMKADLKLVLLGRIYMLK